MLRTKTDTDQRLLTKTHRQITMQMAKITMAMATMMALLGINWN